MSAALIRPAQRRLKVKETGIWGPVTDAAFHAAMDELERLRARVATPAPAPIAPALPTGPHTERVLLELLSHEAIVLEAYKDSKGVWTWGAGVTNASGHQVHPRYLDKPQTVQRVLEVFVWLCRTKYGPEVIAAFPGRTLTEAQFAAALSFHFNTGGIGRATWVRSWLSGDVAAARQQFMDWRRPPEIVPRREKERDLFLDGKWTGDGKTNVYPVRKPSYTPAWGLVRRVDVRAELREAMR